MSRRSTSTVRRATSRFQIGEVNEDNLTLSAVGATTQTAIRTLQDDQFQAAGVKVPGLGKVDLTFSIPAATTGSANIDVFVLRLPNAVTTPTLTGALNWADLLKGIQVLGYKRFLVGTTSIPRIARIPVRSFPNLSIAEGIRVLTVTRPLATVTFTGNFRTVPKFRVT